MSRAGFVFFIGLFVIVGGAERAGLTQALCNVPAVMLLRTLVPSFPDSQAGWLTLAMASTLAGNLFAVGSIWLALTT
jgi:Na+/H+ antiporter NhaD/arsenite permease-like protein